MIDLGALINVLTREVLLRLSIIGLRDSPTILQLVENSTIKPDGMIVDIIVTLDSLDFPLDFVVLSPKGTLRGYPLILGRPWLANVDACIACQSRKMKILDGAKTKKLTLYFPAQPQLDLDQVSWLDLSDDPSEVNSI